MMKINFSQFGQTLTDKVIIINGPSCCGKTTVAKEICNQSNDEFVILQIDEVKKYLSTTNFKIPFREVRRPICDEIMLQMAKIFLKNGKNVVIDTTFNAEDNAMKLMKYHIDFFKNERVLFVGIDCPLEERLKRFRTYNNNPVRNEKEIIVQSNVFELCKDFYNIWFDSSKIDGEKIATEILKEINFKFTRSYE